MQGGAIPWQNVQFVKKAYITEIMSAILIEDPTKYGNQTSNVWAVKLTEYHRNYMFVLPALDLVKLRELSKLFKNHRDAVVLFLCHWINCQELHHIRKTARSHYSRKVNTSMPYLQENNR